MALINLVESFTKKWFARFFAASARSAVEQEANQPQHITTIKQMFQSLFLWVKNLPAEYANSQKILKAAVEYISDISPVDNGAGNELELQILQSLKKISELLAAIPDIHSDALQPESEKLLMLVQKRKQLRT